MSGSSMTWTSSPDSNRCSISIQYLVPHAKSCWRGGSKTTGCNLSLIHTHPWFTWEASKGLMCNDEEIASIDDVNGWNRGGMDFSPDDVDAANTYFVEGHLGVSDRSCVRALRRTGWREPVSGTCTPKDDLPDGG